MNQIKLAILAEILAMQGEATISHLTSISEDARAIVVSLGNEHWITSRKSHGARYYTITPAGQKLIEANAGSLAGPRSSPSKESYLPVKVFTRPGAMDAYSLPSVESGKRVERARPVIMGSTVIPTIFGR